MESKTVLKKVGLIGIGLMGEPIARRILRGGYSLRIWNRTSQKCESLLRDGAILSDSPKELALNSDIIILSLKDEFAVEAVIFGINGIVSAGRQSQIIVDHSTICPAKVQNITNQLKSVGIKYLDAPVTGSVSGATHGSLTAFIGGDADDIESVDHIFSLYIKKINHMGMSGMGQAAKICNQTVLLNMIIAMFEMINLARKQGIDDKLLLTTFENSLFDCKAWQIYGHAAILNSDQKLAPIKNVIKDLNYIKDIGVSNNSPTYITEISAKLVEKLMKKGMGDDDILKLMQIYTD